MTRTETLADIASRYPAIPKSVVERHWRKSEAFLRMLNRKYAAHYGGGGRREPVQAAPDTGAKGGAGIARAGARANCQGMLDGWNGEDKTK